MDLTDPSTAARLDALGLPAHLARTLTGYDVGVGMLERLHATGITWAFVQNLVTSTSALRTGEDVSALVTFLGMAEEAEVGQWARLGSLDAGLRLHQMSVPWPLAHALAATAGADLSAVLRMLQTTRGTGIHLDDALHWHTAGVLTLSPPYLNQVLWGRWRAAAVHHLGMPVAALAAAAGLTVEEAVQQRHAGELDPDTLRLLAGLRTGH